MSWNLVLQVSSFALSLIGFILALYVLALNFRHAANRHLSLMLLIFAASNLFAGLILDPSITRDNAVLLTYGLGTTAPAFQFALMLLMVVLLKPTWMSGKWGRINRRWLWWPLYALMWVPGLLTLLDVNLGTRFWYTGLDAAYQGGFVELSDYASGSLASLLRILSFMVVPLISILVTLYVAWRGQRVTSETRRLAWLLFGAQFVAAAIQFAASDLSGVLFTSISGAVYIVAYGYAAFQQMVSERRLQRGRLQGRMVFLTLAIAVPLLIAVAFFLTSQAARQIERDANEQLRLANVSLKGNVQTWLTLNIQIIQHIASLPDIVSMDPARQKPVLVAAKTAHPYLLLVHTTDLQGKNVARNDSGQLQNYEDRKWFQNSIAGLPITLEAVISRTSGRPVVNMGTPIKDAQGAIVGVADMNSELDQISAQVQASLVGQTGVAFVVEANNRVVAHPDSVFTNELRDLSGYAPVAALRRGMAGYFYFKDENGIAWYAYLDQLDNGWGVVVQQQESEVRAAVLQFQAISMMTVGLGAMLMAAFVAFAMRQAFHPVNTLTLTAAAVAAGDLTRGAPVESDDELGTLAQTFNSMTAQLRDLIGSLEGRVAERTADLQQRSRYLQASAEVGRAAASILEADQLVQQVVQVIRDQFELYYVALFMVDSGSEQAVLRAGTGEAGRARLARGFQLPLSGESSMIAWCIKNGQPRIAQEAEKDEVRLASSELPDTRSEVALPLRSRGRVLGALSLQSDRPNAFDEATLAVLQIMADQVAVALDNARLFAESEIALERSRQAFGELAQRAWGELLRGQQVVGYRYEKSDVMPVRGDWSPEMIRAVQSGRSVSAERKDEAVLAVPLQVRGRVIGVVNLRRADLNKVWSQEEKELVESLAEQLGTAMESARLYQDTQRRAARERVIGQVSERIRQELDLEQVLKTTVDEIQRVLGLEKAAIRLVGDQGNGHDPADQALS